MPTANYPTREEIMAEEQMFKPELLAKIREWKKTRWYPVRQASNQDKFQALRELVMVMSTIYNKPANVEFAPEIGSCCYVPMNNTIYVNGTVSIISTMHEFAHHLFGADETKACKWSVWLFKKTFPKAFEQLQWNGHMLVKRNPLMEYEAEATNLIAQALKNL